MSAKSVKLNKSEGTYSDNDGKEVSNTSHTIEVKPESPIALTEVSEMMLQHPEMKNEIWKFFTTFCEREQIEGLNLRNKDQNDYVAAVQYKQKSNRIRINWAGCLTVGFLGLAGILGYLNQPWVAGLSLAGAMTNIVRSFLFKSEQKNTIEKVDNETE